LTLLNNFDQQTLLCLRVIPGFGQLPRKKHP
jgi:hypothetical protein